MNYTLPSDKSISQRAILLAAIADGTSEIIGSSFSYLNVIKTVNAIKELGIKVENGSIGENRFIIKIHGRGLKGLSKPEKAIDCGGSATLIRLLAGILCAQDFDSVLTGDEHLLGRPIGNIIEPLKQMGAKIERIPEGLKIYGGAHIRGILYKTPIKSAQVKSSMMFAALYANHPFTFIEGAPTRDHTERLFDACGIDVRRENDVVVVIPEEGIVKPFRLFVPGDISSASFLILAATLLPDCEAIFEGVLVNSTRLGFIEILRSMGADITFENIKKPVFEGEMICPETVADIRVRSAKLRGTTVCKDTCVRATDELLLVAVAGAFAVGKTVVKDADFLHSKECDRIEVMADVLRKIGADITPTGDGWIINGKNYDQMVTEQVREEDFMGDHRVAMSYAVAMAVLSMCSNQTTFMPASCVETSYKNFYEDLNLLVYSCKK